MDHSKIDPSQQQAPAKRVYAGKYNCYFEGCNDYFDDADVSIPKRIVYLDDDNTKEKCFSSIPPNRN